LTYHVNMRLGQRFIARETIIQATESYEIVEEYPEDKCFLSYLVLGRRGDEASCLVRMWKGRTLGSSRPIILARKSGRRI